MEKSYERHPGPLPVRWLNCPRKSTDLIGSKFLAFKTPLNERFDDQVPPQNRFTPAMLFGSMKSYKVKIGLWVDLTNSERFYVKEEVEEHGAKYIKVKCRGFGHCPSDEQVKLFVELCDKFIKKNPLEIIAVHCTHGFNRSGFMIASYFVLKEDWSLDLALNAFTHSRPPGIYKGDYINELYSLYDDVQNAPAPPPLPDWCLGEPDADDDIKNDRSKKRRKPPKVGIFMEGVPDVEPLVEEPKLSQIQNRMQVMCKWKGSGFPGCQPVSMTMENIALVAQKDYKVSWKADGARYMMFISGKNEIFFADRDFCIFFVKNLEFREKHNLNAHLCDTLLDGEMVIDSDPVKKTKFPRYLIYDVIRIHGKDVATDNFHLRFQRIYTDIISPRNAAIEKGLINKAKEPFSIRRKDFWDVSPHATSKLLSEKFKNQLWHEPDGLIFQPIHEHYLGGTCKSVLKWKPASHNSIDFKVKITTAKQEGCLNTTTAELYVGQYNFPVWTMKATKEMRALDGKIAECRYDMKSKNWILMRERTDKSFPNAFSTAQAVLKSIENPVTEEILLNFIETNSFRKDAEIMPPPAKRAC